MDDTGPDHARAPHVSGRAADPRPWWRRPFRVYQTNLRELDATLDVPAALDHMERIGADVWLINTAGIVSFYPSELPYQHPSPWLGRRPGGDLIGDAIEQAHRRGIKIVSRLHVSKVHRDVAEAHPDWVFRGPTGRFQIYNGLYSACASGPYLREKVLEVITEILDRYRPDGFFVNKMNFNNRDYSGVQHGICHCEHCHRRFRAFAGLELPAEHSLDQASYLPWLDYTRTTLIETNAAIAQLVKQRGDDIALFRRDDGDVDFREVNSAVDRPEPHWIHWAGELVRQAHGDRARPVVVDSVMFLDQFYRHMIDQQNLIALYLIQTIAHGGNPMVYIMGTEQRFERGAFDAAQDVLGFHRDHQGLYGGLSSVARVALIASQASEDRDDGRLGVEAVLGERRGIHRALVQEHIGFDIIADSRLAELTAADLVDRYEAIILPRVSVLADDMARTLDAYVAAGGGLVVTGEVGRFDGQDRPRDEIPLASLGADRVLARYGPAETRSSYLRCAENEPVGYNRFIAIDRAFDAVRPRPGAESVLPFIPASPYGPPEKSYWEIETEHPGLVRFRHGRGRTVFLPWPVGLLFHEWSLPEYRRLIANAVDAVSSGRRMITTTASAQVEFTVARTADGRLVVHLINLSGQNGRAVHEPVPMSDLRFTVSGDLLPSAGSVRAHPLRAGSSVAVSPADGGWTVLLPRLESFDVVVLTVDRPRDRPAAGGNVLPAGVDRVG